MVINVVALITIAANARIFHGDRKQRTENRSRNERNFFRESGERFSRGMSRRLNLSKEQQERIEELREANHEEIQPLMARMDTVRKNLNEAMGLREIDEVKIRDLNEEMMLLDGQIRNNLFKYNLQFRSLLNDVQLEKYLVMHKRMRGRDGGQRGRGDKINMIMGI